MSTTPAAKSSASSESAHAPLPDVALNIYKPDAPCTARVVRNDICTASHKAAGYVRHIELDISGTDLVGKVFPGQSIGVLPAGQTERGKPHKVRLYSVASPSTGEDSNTSIISTTVKRTLDEHWETHQLFVGVASNYLCDLQVGDEVQLTGPAGKRFLLPASSSEHDYIFFATGTGIAPFRGMILDLLSSKSDARVMLVMGSPYHTDLLYHDLFTKLDAEHENFTYMTAISRERQHDDHDRMYVQDRLRTDRNTFSPLLLSDRTLIYVCGLAGMELGIFRELATQLSGESLEQYLQVDPEIMHDFSMWDRRMVGRQIKPTSRVFLEVYA